MKLSQQNFIQQGNDIIGSVIFDQVEVLSDHPARELDENVRNDGFIEEADVRHDGVTSQVECRVVVLLVLIDT